MAAHESDGVSPQCGGATRAEWLIILKDKHKMTQEAANEWLASKDASFFKSQEGLEYFGVLQAPARSLSPTETPAHGWPTMVSLDQGDANLGGGAASSGHLGGGRPVTSVELAPTSVEVGLTSKEVAPTSVEVGQPQLE